MVNIGNYELLDMINEGGFARIFQARHIVLDELACIKQSKDNSPDVIELLRQEAKILWRTNHHSIPQAKEFMQIKDGSYIMIMDYINGKSIEDLIPTGSRLHAEDVCWIGERLLETLFYCHYHGVIHGDVKPGNVLVEKKEHDIKLIDFGLSVYRPTSLTKPEGCTALYAPPEIIQKKPPIPETDLYGAGMVMLYALGGDIKSKSFPDDVPKEIADFCNALLKFDPVQRPNWEKQNLIKELSDIRYKVFGRRHTSVYAKTKL